MMPLKKIKNYVSDLLTKKNDKEITKKNILIGFLTSPFIMLIIANILYGLTLSILYKNKKEMFDVSIILLTSWPFLVFCLPMSIYSYFIYKYKTFYMSYIGNPLAIVLGVALLLTLNLFFVIKGNIFATVYYISFVNIFVGYLCFLSVKKALSQLDNLNTIDKFKFAFIDDNMDKVVAFINKLSIFYYSKYVVINGYKLSYQDVDIFENQFNKRLYDFNKDEINVVTMYALN